MAYVGMRFEIEIIENGLGQIRIAICNKRNFDYKEITIEQLPSMNDTFMEAGEQIGNSITEMLLRKDRV